MKHTISCQNKSCDRTVVMEVAASEVSRRFKCSSCGSYGKIEPLNVMEVPLSIASSIKNVICCDCSNPIPEERLKVQKTAIRCAPCENRREKKSPSTKMRHVNEPLGTREDFKKDRNSFKRLS